MTNRSSNQTQHRDFGQHLLGPIVNLYLLRLHAHILQSDPARDRILFVLRAGLRLQNLYIEWCRNRGVAPAGNLKLFKSSRLMAMKAAYDTIPAIALTALGRELEGESLDIIVRGLLRAEGKPETRDAIPFVPPQPLHDFMASDNAIAARVRRHLRQQSQIFRDYVAAIAGPAERLLLVDTGWRGTQQLLFEQAFPERNWAGLYFGCIGRAEILGKTPGTMTGLMFDADAIRPDIPCSALVQHRHLIESVLEPHFPSVERIDRADVINALKPSGKAIKERRLSDPVYDGVRDHIGAHAADGPAVIADLATGALESLADMIALPDRTAARLLAPKPRSLDLGRTGSVSVLLPSRDRHPDDSPEQRIKDALWPPGQAAIEYDGPRRLRIQERLRQAATATPIIRSEPRVAVVTRTKDRPLLLARAARSVAAQTYRNLVWVVVNDGGDPDTARDVIKAVAIDPARVHFCSFDESQGMEAASNAGIEACASDLVVIHDDDDSWEASFLTAGVAFLEQHDPLYGGVVSHSTYISEEIAAGSVRECARKPFNGWLMSIHLAEMAVANLFPPIAFLYRRGLWETLGGYDESLPVLGDWDFNLRFLLQADIGVLPQPLANYHHRVGGGPGGAYANSDVAARNPHIAYNAILRNRYIRGAGRNREYATLAGLMCQGYAHEDLRARMEQVRGTQGSTPFLEPDALESGAAPLRRLCEAQKRELDRRWVLLHMTVSEIITARGLSIGVEEMIGKLSALAEDYAGGMKTAGGGAARATPRQRSAVRSEGVDAV